MTYGIKLFLAGDVMLGRGIDAVMRRSANPQLFERFASSAEEYVQLAERANGPIARPVDAGYVWGDALAAIDAEQPDCRIVNLETAVTTSPAAWPGKPIHYRTHPSNVDVLLAARIDCCVLANNHVLDWGEAGLHETLDSLHRGGLATAGAGRSEAQAWAPVVIERPQGRVVVTAIASTTSGTPVGWGARSNAPGVAVFERWSDEACERIAERLSGIRRTGDVVVVSVHWGTNLGYGIPDGQRRLAHSLVDVGGADIVFGHSSHHARPIELYRGRLILYGCGDFINDYEGIEGHEEFRPDLVLAWFANVDPETGQTVELTMAPFQEKRFRLTRPAEADIAWLAATLDRHSSPFGIRVDRALGGTLRALPAE